MATIRKREALTPLLQLAESRFPSAMKPLFEDIITLRPGKEHRVDGVLRIKNCSSTVDPGRRGARILAGSEENPLFQECLFFGKDENVCVEYSGRSMIIEGSDCHGIRLRISLNR